MSLYGSSDSTLLVTLKHFTRLTTIDFGLPDVASFYQTCDALSFMPLLHTLSITCFGNEENSDALHSAFEKIGASSVRKLQLRCWGHMPSISDQLLLPLAQAGLVSLDLSLSGNGDEQKHYAEGFSGSFLETLQPGSLTQLHLNLPLRTRAGTQTATVVERIEQLKRQKAKCDRIKLHELLPSLTKDVMSHLFTLSSLTKLDLRVVLSLEHDMRQISNLARLTSLTLDVSEPREMKCWFPFLPVSLESLNLASSSQVQLDGVGHETVQVSPSRSYFDTLPELLHLVNIRYMKLKFGGLIRAQEVKQLVSMPHLSALEVVFMPFSDSGIEETSEIVSAFQALDLACLSFGIPDRAVTSVFAKSMREALNGIELWLP